VLRQLLVELQCLAHRGDVVEADGVGVPTGRPDEHDVMDEGTFVRLWGHEDGAHPPTSDPHPGDRLDSRARIPGGAADDFRVVAEPSRRGSDDEMRVTAGHRRSGRNLGRDVAGAEDPASPGGRTARARAAGLVGRTDAVQKAVAPARVPLVEEPDRHPRRAGDGIADRACSALAACDQPW